MMIITIDGPSGSGKTTLAKAIAKRMSYVLLDSGLIYRAVAYLGLVDFEYKVIDHESRIFYQNQDFTSKLRSLEVAQKASLLSQNSEVRDFVNEKQRNFAKDHSLVAEGRDMGSVVFPDADLKIFLTADLEIRAQRRALEIKEDVEKVRQALKLRDEQDQQRSLAPLVIPKGALELDSSQSNLEELLDKVLCEIDSCDHC